MADAFVIDAHELQALGESAQAAYAELPGEMTRAMTKGVLSAEKEAKAVVPVDTGNLRRTITHEVQATGDGVIGKVGTNAPYGKPVEYGTGLLSEAPDSSHARYMPPPGALDRWAIKKGFTVGSATSARAEAGSTPGVYGHLVAWAIYLAGGTKPKPYLRPALKKVIPELDKEFAQVVPRLLKKFGGS